MSCLTANSCVRRWLRRFAGVLIVLTLPTAVCAQTAAPSSPQGESPWSARTRIQLTGTSDSSDPAGYEVYSGFPIELSLRRDLSRRFGVEVAAALESREVETIAVSATKGLNLGSIETLPINVLFQVHPWSGGRVRPYAGLGANFTVFYEKSGALDSMDLTPGVGVALQLGTDIVLSRSAVFNLDVRWNQLETDLETNGSKIARLKINPMTLGIGFGFRF